MLKKYHVSRNLFDVSTVEKGRIDNGVVGYTSQTTSLSIVGDTVYFTTNAIYRGVCSGFFEIPETGNISFNFTRNLQLGVRFVFYDSNKTWLNADVVPTVTDIPPATVSIPTGAKFVRLSFTGQLAGGSDYVMSDIMLNVGSTPLPYEPYSSEVWHEIPYYLHNTSTDTITTLPADIYANAATATVGLKGQTVQSGTPSPQNPVMPNGCGNMTGNLFSSTWEQGIINAVTGNNQLSNDNIRTVGYIPVQYNTIYSMSRNKYSSYMSIRLYDANNEYIGSGSDETIQIIVGGTVANPMRNNQNFCCFKLLSQNVAYLRINDNTNDLTTKYMMVEGQYTTSTMPAYEPYGYKIPISSAGQTTPVYLGEVETTRKIKKLVLTGQESGWGYSTVSGHYFGQIAIPQTGIDSSSGNPRIISSHYVGMYSNENNIVRILGNGEYLRCYDDTNAINDTAWKTYLQQQYAAGTPVTVWYVLATEETTVVNEPLQKIGDYADTLSNVSIPVTAGGDTISVGTTVQPSEINVNYKGWHPKTPKESNNGSWT